MSVLILAPAALSAQYTAGGDLGAVSFRVSCAPEVRGAFDQAVALLHHMMYVESRSAFEQIARRDPGCGMAHWGLAMTHFHPLWYPASPDALRRGWESLQQALASPPATARERALIAATEAFYRDPEDRDWWARLRRWSEAMDAAHRAHPDDVDVAALYGVSVLAAAQLAKDRPVHNARAAEVLLRIHERQPTHPGAVHYLIHANDISGRAGKSLEVVRSYDGIAPSVPHALHMPTHIFVRLGEWPGVIAWNRRSADAALRFPVGDRVSTHFVHALDYLAYAYLQRGEDGKARAVLNEATGHGQVQEDFVSAFHLAAMPARFAVERREWGEAAAVAPRTPTYIGWDRFPWAEALSWFARGLGATRTGNLAAAREAESRMGALREQAESAGQPDHARYIEIDRLILAGYLQHAQGDLEAAVARLREAAELEGSIQKHPVTPGALLPPHEALGDLLLQARRPREALAAYEASLKIWPQRYHSLLGAARATGEAGDAAGARRYYAELLKMVDDAETDRQGVREARAATSAR